MARWITQTFSINTHAEIILNEDCVVIGDPMELPSAIFKPKDLQDAMGMSIALRAAAKRVEEIGKQMVK
ncbi:MAG: hypothetical protein C0436_04080 [Alphaproteobacteria bacterium]|nr:hypothetical protein [Alphaproteobacteria bacterium]